VDVDVLPRGNLLRRIPYDLAELQHGCTRLYAPDCDLVAKRDRLRRDHALVFERCAYRNGSCDNDDVVVRV
jgi:hypothetical protein